MSVILFLLAGCKHSAGELLDPELQGKTITLTLNYNPKSDGCGRAQQITLITKLY